MEGGEFCAIWLGARGLPRGRGPTPMRDIIQLACGDCKRRNYSTTKNKKKTTERLEMSKYCRFCRKHTAHKEQK